MTVIGGIEVIYRPANRDFSKRWSDFNPSTTVLPKGWRKDPDCRALDEDLIFERDISISLRDGSTIYADVFRPVMSEDQRVPAIIAWSPYGKQGNGQVARTFKNSTLMPSQVSKALIGCHGGPVYPSHGQVTLRSSRLRTQQSGVLEAMRS